MLCGEALEISSPAMEDEDDCRRATLRCKDRRCPPSLLLPARQTRGEELHNALLSGDVGAKSGAEHGGDQAARCVEAEVHWNTCASATKSAMLVTHLARFSPLEVIPNVSHSVLPRFIQEFVIPGRELVNDGVEDNPPSVPAKTLSGAGARHLVTTPATSSHRTEAEHGSCPTGWAHGA